MVAAAGISAVGSLMGARKASKSALRAQREYNKIAQAQLDFAMEQYNDWEAVFGPVQDILSEYYSNLTPELIEAQGLEEFELEKEAQMGYLRETLAQRGIATSGIAAEAETQAALASASTRARIRAEAPMKAAQQQAEFLRIGLNQNPANSVLNVMGNQANTAGNMALSAGQAAGQAQRAAIGATTDFITDIIDQFGQNKTGGQNG